MDLINSKRNLSVLAILVFAAGAMVATPSLAATKSNKANAAAVGAPAGQGQGRGQGQMKPGVIGTVTAVSGTTLTISGVAGGPDSSAAAAATYTVDASNATLVINNVTSTISAIAVGNKIDVRGTVSGNSIAATSIRVGEMRGGSGEKKDGSGGPASSTAPAITGNGQPVVAGTVSAISGTTMTVSTKSGIAYTVDVSSAKIVKGKTTITISDVAVNDTVVVQGATNGTSVTASSVIDETNAGTGNATSTAAKSGSHGIGNFFGSIGKFFKSLFGF